MEKGLEFAGVATGGRGVYGFGRETEAEKAVAKLREPVKLGLRKSSNHFSPRLHEW